MVLVMGVRILLPEPCTSNKGDTMKTWEEEFTRALEKQLRGPLMGPYLREQERLREEEIKQAQASLLEDLQAGKFDDFLAK